MQANKRDELIDKLGIGDIDESGKKDLFNKFVNAGGEVIDLDKNAKREAEAKEAKSSPSRAVPSSQRPESDRVRRPDDASRAASSASQPSVAENLKANPVNRWIERFSAKLGCSFSGVFNLGGKKFKRKFIDLILEKYQNALLESRMVMASAIRQNDMIRDEIRKKLSLDRNAPYLYELIYRFDELYDEEAFGRASAMNADSELVDSLKPIFIRMFKPLYILKAYSLTLKSAAERTLLFEKDIRQLEAGTTFANYRKVSNAIDYIYQKVYPKLFSLIDYYYKVDTKDKPTAFKDYIQIVDADLVGYLTSKWREENEFVAQKERLREDLQPSAEASEDGEAGMPETPVVAAGDTALRGGLELLRKYINFENTLTAYRSKKDLRALFSLNDKVFLTYVMIDFFDREYSFLITSNKVGFNVNFNYGNRIDIKKDLTDTYYKINTLVYERVNEYLKVIREIYKITNDGYMNMDERTVRLNQCSVQRSQISRTLRKEARDLFDRFTKTLIMVVSDYEGNKLLLQNGEDTLVFDKKIDGERLLDGQQVIEAIREAYYFAYLIHFMLVQGDLGGFSVIVEKAVYLPVRPVKTA